MNLYKTFFIIILLFAFSAHSSELDRRANWGASFTVPAKGTAGVKIKSVKEGSPLQKAGLKIADHILLVDKKPILSSQEWYDITDGLVAGKKYTIKFNRAFKSYTKEITFEPMEKEKHPNIETTYDQLTNDYGIKQRLIITRPNSKKSKLPAVLFLQGLSCSSIEINPNRITPFTRLINEIVEKSNHVVLRIEKPGLGDSEGNCSETDFMTELNGYEQAAQYLKQLEYVDSNKITVYGNSMGSALAPYIANKYNYTSVISDGTFVKSWFEHMLEIQRRILDFQGLNQTEINDKLNQAYMPLYYGMLILNKSYQDVTNQYPAIASDNYHGPKHMYGRPMEYYQQLQQFDVAGEWQKLKVPARIRWGTNDWIMSESDNDMIIDILKKAGHSDHKLHKQKGLDHWQSIHQSAKDSFDGKKGEWIPEISEVIIHWLDELNK